MTWPEAIHSLAWALGVVGSVWAVAWMIVHVNVEFK